MKNSNFGQFTRYSINTIIIQFLTLAAGVIVSIIIARVLGPQGKGELALILLIPTLVITLGKMGIGHAINYYASKMSPTKLIVNSFIVSIFLSIILLIITLPALSLFKNTFFEWVNEKTLIFICFSIPFLLIGTYLNTIMQGYYKINLCNFLTASQSIIYLFTLIVFIVILKLGLFGAIISWMISLVVVFSLSVFLVLKEFKLEKIGLDFRIMRQLLTFGIKSHIGNVAKDLTYRADILIISFFLSPIFIGYYAVAVAIAETIWKIPDAIGTVLLPRIAHLDKDRARIFTPVVCRRTILPVMAACFIIFLLSNSLITFFFGESFHPSSSILILLLPGVFALSLWKMLANDIIAQGHPIAYSFTSGFALCTMIVMDLFLIPRFGINGAAIASSISYIIATISIVFIYVRITKNTLKSLIIPLKSDFIFYKGIVSVSINNFGQIINRNIKKYIQNV